MTGQLKKLELKDRKILRKPRVLPPKREVDTESRNMGNQGIVYDIIWVSCNQNNKQDQNKKLYQQLESYTTGLKKWRLIFYLWSRSREGRPETQLESFQHRRYRVNNVKYSKQVRKDLEQLDIQPGGIYNIGTCRMLITTLDFLY